MKPDALDLRLIERLSDGQFHSGSALAAWIGISRAAIWKHLRALESLGLEVPAGPGRGYRLLTPVEPLSESRLKEDLSPKSLALLQHLDLQCVVDSTNAQLLRRAQAGGEAGSVCIAEYQSAGRGRVGRAWVSPYGANIYLSLLWRFQEPSQLGGLSLAVAVVALRALQALGIQGIQLKWPNDLIFQGRKLGGILIELAGEAHGGCAAVVGIGLNRYVPKTVASAIDQPFIDLNSISGTALPSRHRVLAALIDRLLPMLKAYPETGLAPFLGEWRNQHAYDGSLCEVDMGGSVLAGRIEGITAAGLLLIRDVKGHLREIASGDVRVRVKAV